MFPPSGLGPFRDSGRSCHWQLLEFFFHLYSVVRTPLRPRWIWELTLAQKRSPIMWQNARAPGRHKHRTHNRRDGL